MRAVTRHALPLSAFHPAAWAAVVMCVSPVVLASPPRTSPPAPRKPRAAAVTAAPVTTPAPAVAPAPADPAAVAPAAALSKPSLAAVPSAPADGPLERHDLIQLAIQGHPDFWRFRGEVAFYLQAEAAAYDWRDPELRIGFDHEFESDLSRAYEETRSINTTETGAIDSISNTAFTENDGSGDLAGIISGATQRQEQLTRSGQMTTETVQKITPGKYEDIIERTTYEVEKRQDQSRENRQGPGFASENRAGSEYSRRRVLSRSREYRSHPNDVYGDETFVVQARLFIPNPWEVKARAARARAEATLSNTRLRSEVRDLVFDVGRRYDELQFRYAWHQANQQLVDLQEENLKVIEEEAGRLSAVAATSGIRGLYDPSDLPKARLEISKAREEVFDSGREMALVREELGVLCGLADPGRIVLTNALRVRKISGEQLDVASLVELARAHRPDLGEMQARGEVERARLREVKAQRLPWINDLRVGFGRTSSDGYRDQDELTALLSLNLPLVSWWQNKSHRQHEEAMASFEEARKAMGQRIEGQVTFAVRAIHEATAALAQFAAGEKRLYEDVAKNRAEAATAGDKQARIELDAKEALIKSGRGRLQALYHYNQAVAHLELALGMPVEEAFAAPSPAPARAAGK